MLVHICCSVDSHYFLQRLKEEYPSEELIGFFYNPNIHPYSEYRLRLLDVQFSCKKLGIKLIEGEYDLNSWLNSVSGLEQEPEKGNRCTVCFDNRLSVTAQKAKQLHQKSFTTTLLISPKKSQDKLLKIGNSLAQKYGIEFIFKDYRSKNGTQIQSQVVKQNSLYRQNYCGCLFGLTMQREEQERLMDEMISNIGKQIQPNSIESKIKLYNQRNLLQEENKSYKIIKQRFLNYRLLRAIVKIDKKTVPSYILSYSTLKSGKTQGRIEYEKDGICYLNRDEVKIIDISSFNKLTNSKYKNTKELIFDTVKFEDELTLRSKITNNPYDLSAVIVVDKIVEGKFEIVIESKTYEDIEEKII